MLMIGFYQPDVSVSPCIKVLIFTYRSPVGPPGHIWSHHGRHPGQGGFPGGGPRRQGRPADPEGGAQGRGVLFQSLRVGRRLQPDRVIQGLRVSEDCSVPFSELCHPDLTSVKRSALYVQGDHGGFALPELPRNFKKRPGN